MMNLIKKISAPIMLSISLLFIAVGTLNKEYLTVLKKAINICLECIGVG